MEDVDFEAVLVAAKEEAIDPSENELKCFSEYDLQVLKLQVSFSICCVCHLEVCDCLSNVQYFIMWDAYVCFLSAFF